MSDTARRSEDVYPGPRRKAIDAVDANIKTHEDAMNVALDMGDYMLARSHQQWVASYRLGRDSLFTCSIHEIDGVYDFDTGRGE